VYKGLRGEYLPLGGGIRMPPHMKMGKRENGLVMNVKYNGSKNEIRIQEKNRMNGGMRGNKDKEK